MGKQRSGAMNTTKNLIKTTLWLLVDPQNVSLGLDTSFD